MNKGKSINSPPTRVKWTTLELQVLGEKYPIMGAKIPELLERHPVGSIYTKATREGVRKIGVPAEKYAKKTHFRVVNSEGYFSTACNQPAGYITGAWTSICSAVTCDNCKKSYIFRSFANEKNL